MPFVLVRGAHLAIALLWLVALPLPAAAQICCNQSGAHGLTPAQANANLVCPLGAPSCSIGTQTVASPANCSTSGCALDFSDRPVSFDGTFTVGSGTFFVKARSIAVNKSIVAGGTTLVELRTTGTGCASGAGDLVVRQPIDISAPTAGVLRLISSCRIGLETGGQLVATSGSWIGGIIDLRAATTITQAAPLKALGGGSDGGQIFLTAGADVQVQRPIDVHSLVDGDGGSIALRAGDRVLAGAALGGTLTVNADLISDGSTSADGLDGGAGGDITLEASGPIIVNGTATIRANGASPDGEGGFFTVGNEEPPTGVLTALDGDASLLGPVVLRGATNGDGGEVDTTIGRTLLLQGSFDVSGGGDDASAGSVHVTAGSDARLEGAIVANGRVTSSGGGSVDVKAGMAIGTATLTAAKTIDVSAGSGGDGGDARLSACRLVVQPGVVVDARGSLQSFVDPGIILIGSTALTLGANARFLAQVSSGTRLVRAPNTAVSIGSGVTFNPRVTTTVASPERSPFPPCPVCGDGVHQADEPCDPGAAADGACCSSDCLRIICATPTPSPTPTVQATGPTPTPTVTVTRTATRTPTPTATATPPLPPLAPRAVLGCERALAKASSRLITTDLDFLETCALDALPCLSGGDAATCLTRVGRRCQTRFAHLTRAHQTFRAAFAKACAGDPPALPFEALRSTAVLSFATLDETCAADVGLELTSPGAVLTCVEHATCTAERALTLAIPHLGTLLRRVFDTSSAGFCLATTDGEPPVETIVPGRNAVRCQRAIVAGGRKLVGKQLTTARRCVDSLLACRLAGGNPAACAAVAERCGRKLAALADPAAGTRARLTGTVVRACVGVAPDALVLPTGLGFGSVADTCAALGVPPPTDGETLAPCIGAAYGCAAGAVTRRALPMVDGELARAGLELGPEFACPIASPSPTPTATPGGATRTPTATATPTVVPTAAPVTLLVAGGGSGATDCIAEWTVVGRPVESPSTTAVSCTDGDPACDLDGIENDVCEFAVGVCLIGTDPSLPDCSAAMGLESYTLQSPQPGASNPVDAANAAGIVTVLTDLVGSAPGGGAHNVFTFEPPLVLTPPANCTAPTTILVERRTLLHRTERLRARAVAATASGGDEDRDTLLLTCVAPGS